MSVMPNFTRSDTQPSSISLEEASWNEALSPFYWSNVSESVPIVDNFEELSDNEFDTYVLYPWTWRNVGLDIPIYVYIIPPFAFTVLVVNCIVVYIFFREKMVSTTNVLLIGIAISDTLCIIAPTPLLIYLYAFISSSDEQPDLPYELCRIWDYVIKNSTSVMHTASIWLTVCLAAHRYVCVCHPFAAKRYFTRKRTIWVILITYLTSIILHSCRYIDTEYHPVFMFSNKTSDDDKLTATSQNNSVTCRAVHVQWLRGYEIMYECIYYWLYIILVIIIPCTTLILLSILMVKTLRRSDALNMQFITESRLVREGNNRHKNRVRLTKLIIGIVTIVTLVELPLGISLILWTVTIIHRKLFIPEELLGNISVLLNMIVYSSYPMIFILYCVMSTRFKMAVKAMFIRKKFHRKFIHSDTSAELAVLTRAREDI